MKKSKAQYANEKAFCDAAVTHILASGGSPAPYSRPANPNVVGDYDAGHFEIMTPAGLLTLHPTGHSVFGQFQDSERARRFVRNAHWDHHYFEAANASAATDFKRKLDNLLAMPESTGKRPAPDPTLVAIVRRAVPELGPPEPGPRTLTFFPADNRHFRIGQPPGMVATIHKVGISCDFADPERDFAGLTIVDSHGDHYQMPSLDVIERNGVQGISVKRYGELYKDLEQKAEKVGRALERHRKRAPGPEQSTRKDSTPPPKSGVRVLNNSRGPVCSHGGGCKRCHLFHSVEQHKRHPKSA